MIELLIAFLKDALFQPKDQFERVKKNAARHLLAPLIAVVAGGSIIVAIVSAIQTVEIHTAGFSVKLMAAATDSFIPLSLTVLIAFSLYVGSNYHYTRQVRRSAEEIDRLDRHLRRSEVYSRLKARYYSYLKAEKREEAFTVANLLVKRFPNEVDTDADFLESLLAAAEGPQYAELRGLLIEAPPIDRNPI